MNLKTLKSQRTAEKCSEKEIRRIQEEEEIFLPYNPAQVPCHPKSLLTVLSTHMQRMLLLLLLLSRFSHVLLFATPWTIACQASTSLGFSRQEYWSGLPVPFPMHESEK